MIEYLISDELLTSIRHACYNAGKAGKEVFTTKTPSVEVVRCRDCKNSTMAGKLCFEFETYEPIPGGDEFTSVPTHVDPDGFCAWGERREDA